MKTDKNNLYAAYHSAYKVHGKGHLLVLILSSILCATVFISCSKGDPDPDPPVSQSQGGIVKGKVSDEAGNVYPGTSVRVSNTSDTQQGKTNATGEYSVSTKKTGTYDVNITPPLASQVVTSTPVSINVTASGTQTVDMVISPQAISADLIVGNVDILGELKNSDGMAPVGSDLIYAANVFDPPFGQLTAVKAPDGHHISLNEWKQAKGSLRTTCNGNNSRVSIELEGMIPGGTYTIWLNFLNKNKKAGEPINFASDLVGIQPLGASTGTENIVIAQSNGTINANINHNSCILTKEAGLVLVVVYHINGNTYGSAHIPDTEEISQLLFFFN